MARGVKGAAAKTPNQSQRLEITRPRKKTGKRQDRPKNPVIRRSTKFKWCIKKRRTCLIENSAQPQNCAKLRQITPKSRSRKRTDKNSKDKTKRPNERKSKKAENFQ